jgi:hypothetical protein
VIVTNANPVEGLIDLELDPLVGIAVGTPAAKSAGKPAAKPATKPIPPKR